MDFDLGFFDEQDNRVAAAYNSFQTKSVTYVFSMNRYPCLRFIETSVWWLRVDLNHRPVDYESTALTS